jgi:REP element-mobilizing transposase RayT
MGSKQSDTYFYRGRLPHWRMRGAAYFVTWRLHPSQPELGLAERSVVAAAVRHFDAERYELYAFVVMNDHVHVLLRPLAPFSLESILHSLKSYSARVLQKAPGRAGRIWQPESFDRVILSEQEFLQKARYIADNPYKRWPDLGSYDWVWP